MSLKLGTAACRKKEGGRDIGKVRLIKSYLAGVGGEKQRRVG